MECEGVEEGVTEYYMKEIRRTEEGSKHITRDMIKIGQNREQARDCRCCYITYLGSMP